MTREELVDFTLNQLMDSFSHSPECFELKSSEAISSMAQPYELIVWRKKIIVDDKKIVDPHSDARTVIISYNKRTREMSVDIYLTDINLKQIDHTKAEASTEVTISWPYFSPLYKKFQELKRLIVLYEHESDNYTFFKKLCSIFPKAFDEDLFGRK